MSLWLQKQRLLLLILLGMGSFFTLFGADLQRPYDPVVVKGAQLQAFLGSDTSDIFVYAHKAGGWVQIPFQIDEMDSVNASEGWSYFTAHNGQLGTHDELCFMAADMGDSVGDNSWINDLASIVNQRYQIAAWDTSVTPARKAYAYVYRSTDLAPAFTEYMNYQKGTVGRSDTVSARSYVYGQNRDAIPDYLTLKKGDLETPDIMDRWKIRFKGQIGFNIGPEYYETEETALRDTLVQVRAGAVRVIHRRSYRIIWQGNDINKTLALQSCFYPWSYMINLTQEALPGALGMTMMRQSIDYLPNISGSKFHWVRNSNIPVDGTLDFIINKNFVVPGINWFMVQGDFGTAATVFDMKPIPDTQLSLYYIDDSSKLNGANRDVIGDTGDSLAYGESGVQLSALTDPINMTDQELNAVFYYLPDYHSAAYGDSLAAYSRHPLKVVVMPRTNTVIPVELSSFRVRLNASLVRLEWTTATESNNYGFEVERRSTGEEVWRKIGFVKGHGTTQLAHGYHFADSQAQPGENSYRLKQIDLDGGFTYSAVVSVMLQVPSKLELAQNYPNPFNPGTGIAFTLPDGAGEQRVRLAIFNLLGQKIRTLVDGTLEAGHHGVHWDGYDDHGHNVVSGAYLYRLQMGSEVLTRKMIKME